MKIAKKSWLQLGTRFITMKFAYDMKEISNTLMVIAIKDTIRMLLKIMASG